MTISGVRILVIEDSQEDAELLIRHLTKSGLLFSHQIIDKLDLIEEQINKHKVDVIICDYNLPGFTGTDVIHRINTLDKNIPVILVSGAFPDEQAIDAVVAGAKDYVLKNNFTRLVPAIKREYKALLEKREADKNNLFLESLFESQIGVILSDDNYKILNVNSTYCDMLGYSKKDFLAHPLQNIFPEQIRETIIDSYNGFLENGNSEVYETKNLHKDGSSINVIASSKKISAYNSKYVISTVIDITKRKSDEKKIARQNEQLLREKQTKEKLYSILTHDLRNSLFGMSGFLEIILMDLAKDEINSKILKKKLELAFTSSKNSLKLLEGIHSWVKMQEGIFSPNPRTINLIDEINLCIDLFQTSVSSKNIVLKKELPEHIPAYVDPEMISTISRNLFNNAIKFSNPNSVITIKCEHDMKNGYVTFSITDEGIGMSKEILANLFNLKTRPQRPGTKEETGTGLGLMLIKELAEKNNISISVKSEENIGTEFLLKIPDSKNLSFTPNIRIHDQF